MSTHNVLGLLTIPFLGLVTASGSCKGPESTTADAALGPTHPSTGGARGGSGSGGSSVGPSGTGGWNNGGTSGSAGGSAQGGSAGTGGASTSKGGSAGRDASAGGSGGKAAGSGGNTGKDAGSGGSKAIDGGPVACDDIESPGRLAVYTYDNSTVTGSSIQLNFDVVNFTAFSSRLSQVTVRYWFTDETPSSANVIEQYYVPIPIKMKFITVNPPRTGGDTVLEIAFSEAPDAGISWVETRGFNFAFHKTSYAGTYNQDNDYSYDSELTKTLGSNPRVTAYINGVLAWGCEPPIAPPPPPPEMEADGGVVVSTIDALSSDPIDSSLPLRQ